MAWDVRIINGDVEDRQPLGSREFVVQSLEAAVPGLLLECPPVPPLEVLDIMAPLIRKQSLNPNLQAQYDVDSLTMYFYTINEPTLKWINVEVRGVGDPLSVLAAICDPHGWSVIESRDKSIVDLHGSA